MTYLTLSDLKKHLNLDSAFTDDDAYITALGTAAEEATAKYIDLPLTQLEDANHKLPQALVQGIMLLVGEWYAVREAVSAASFSTVPLAYEFLCALYHDYTINKDE